MSPVMTQPIVGVMLNRCVMVDASRSLSWNEIFRNGGGKTSSIQMCTHRNFSLGDDYSSVFSSHGDSSMS